MNLHDSPATTTLNQHFNQVFQSIEDIYSVTLYLKYWISDTKYLKYNNLKKDLKPSIIFKAMIQTY